MVYLDVNGILIIISQFETVSGSTIKKLYHEIHKSHF